MATEIKTTIDNYQRLPVSDTPSNQPYQTHNNSAAEAASRDRAKTDFLAPDSTDIWPDIEFPQLKPVELVAYRSMLLGLLEDIDDAPEDVAEVSKDTTYDALNQKLLEVNRHITITRMLGQVSLHTEWLDGDSTDRLRERAANQNLEIFGRPETDRFNWLVAQDRKLAETKLQDDDPLMRDVAAEFLSRTADVGDYEQNAPLELTPEVREQLKQDLYDVFPGLEEFCNQDFPETIPVAESLPYFNQMRDIMNLPADKYEAFFTNKRACEETPQGVSVGLKRSNPFKPRDIIRLAFHEWLHVLRRHNAREQKDPARQLPTPSNLAFEEAFCVLAERSLVDESYISGVNYYKSIGLQMNLDKTQDPHDLSKMRNFREVTDILTLAETLKGDKTDEASVSKIKTRVYNQVMRSSRGLALDARDISYHKGDQKAKRAINDIKDLPKDERQDMLKWYFSAQFDPTSEDAKQFL